MYSYKIHKKLKINSLIIFAREVRYKPPTKKERVTKVREQMKTVDADRWRTEMQDHASIHLFVQIVQDRYCPHQLLREYDGQPSSH